MSAGLAAPVRKAGSRWLVERLARAAKALGAPGAWGLGAMLAAGLVAVAGTHHFDAQRTALAEARRQILQQSDRPRSELGERGRLEDFYARFPAQDAMSSRLEGIYAAAEAHGLELPRIDFRSRAEAGTPLVSVELALPLTADFGDLYGWLSGIAVEMPEVAIESIRVQRDAAATREVEASVRLRVYARGRE